MPATPTSHPDRAAATLANLRAATDAAGFAAPGAGAADCRIDLKLLQWRALQAIATSAASREHLRPFAREQHPDLWAGTVQDGVARGFAARLEEAIALAPPPPPPMPTPAPLADSPGAKIVAGRDLKKHKDLLVASGGARVRFTRKEGLLFVDRGADLHSSNCLRFEARRDLGTLDEFVPAVDERPRLYSAQFLQPRRYVAAPAGHELLLAGRLGRGAIGWDCELELTGRPDEASVRAVLRLDNRQRAMRLRARFLGLPLAAIAHECTPVHEVVANDARGFVAFTLVRSVETLRVDGAAVAAPGAACRGPLEHVFRLGTPAR